MRSNFGGNHRDESLFFCRYEQEPKDKVSPKGSEELWMSRVGQKDSPGGVRDWRNPQCRRRDTNLTVKGP
jgi:hypothetical protein